MRFFRSYWGVLALFGTPLVTGLAMHALPDYALLFFFAFGFVYGWFCTYAYFTTYYVPRQ